MPVVVIKSSDLVTKLDPFPLARTTDPSFGARMRSHVVNSGIDVTKPYTREDCPFTQDITFRQDD